MARPRPVLSICIPTYNRAHYLRKCMESILTAAEGFGERVEIVVSDNASADETATVVADLVPSLTIRYARNPENVGPERNFHKAVQLAIGEFIWLFGDDDRMSPEAIASVLDRIDAGYDLVITNFSVWADEFSAPVRPAFYSWKADMTLTDSDDLLRYFGSSLGYISCVVMRRTEFFRLPYREYEAAADHGFSFLLAVYTGLPDHCRAAYLGKPLVLNHGTLTTQSEAWDRMFIVGAPMVIEMLAARGYSRASIAAAKRQHIIRYVVPAMVARKLGGKSLTNTFRLLLPHYRSIAVFWLLCLPIFLAPRPLLSIVHGLVQAIRAARMGNWDACPAGQ